jgi:hypothetical protein
VTFPVLFQGWLLILFLGWLQAASPEAPSPSQQKKKSAQSFVGVAEALTVKEVITLKKQVKDGHFLLSFLC